MRIQTSFLLGALGLVVLLFSSDALAQNSTRVCEDDPECVRLRTEARDLSLAGKFDESQRAYEQAYQRRADPMLLFNLARVLHKAGRPADAITYYLKYLGHGAEGNDEQRRKTEQYIEQARREAALVAPTQTPTPPPVVVA